MKKIICILTLLLCLCIGSVGVFASDYQIVKDGDHVNVLETTPPQAVSRTESKFSISEPLNKMEISPEVSIQAVNSHAEKLGAGMHSGVIMDDNALWTWGDNSRGNLGNGTTTKQSKPVKVLDDVVKTEIAYDGSAAITKNGDLYVWGRNDYGQVGNGTIGNQTTPVKVLENVKEVSIGAFNTAAIKNDGSLWVWGNNYYGQVGNGHTGNEVTVGPDGTGEFTPYIIRPEKIIDSGVVDVSLGQGFSSCVKSDGTLLTWGENDGYQLGNGKTGDIYTPTEIEKNVKAVSVGIAYGLAQKDDGTVLSWGTNEEGEVGNGTNSNQPTPKAIPDLTNVATIIAGPFHAGAITSSGDYYSWGYNGDGELGDGSTKSQLSPKKITSGVDTAALGLFHTLIIKDDGSVWATGNNENSAFGNGTSNSSFDFIKVLENLKPDPSYIPDSYTATFAFNRLYSEINKELDLINAERAKVGASPLTLDQSLTNSAMDRAGEIFVYYSHTRPNDQLCFTINSKMAAENIAAGYPSIEAVMNGWMNSQGHKENILNPSHKSIGIGIATVGNQRYYVQCFGISTGTGSVKTQDEEVAQKIAGFNKRFLNKVKLGNETTSLTTGDSLNTQLQARVENEFQTINLPLITTSITNSQPDVIEVKAVGGVDPNINIKSLKAGNSTVDFVSDTLKCEVKYTVADPVVTPEPSNPDTPSSGTGDTVRIYRVYHEGNKEHLYTSDAHEVDVLTNTAGWKSEGVGWNAPQNGTPVYRLYSPATRYHLYTTDTNEVNVLTTQHGWQKDYDGKPLFYSGGSVPVYRLYHEGQRVHHLTTDLNEYNILGSSGWNKEDVAFYAASK